VREYTEILLHQIIGDSCAYEYIYVFTIFYMGCHVSLQVHPLPINEVPETTVQIVDEEDEPAEEKGISIEDFIPTLDEISMDTINM